MSPGLERWCCALGRGAPKHPSEMGNGQGRTSPQCLDLLPKGREFEFWSRFTVPFEGQCRPPHKQHS
ncbi:hypothetical protein AAFF_G00156030 [Aldrovandia affinis]|uniref:Uncharacterized protein n=1 Tax=Aldrovandia affinis TaxID=143900 RepID=A0AAD7RP09_9TELE|nr:hypothetical protein AAFF_G00156030 [Aldrovandia affinis]